MPAVLSTRIAASPVEIIGVKLNPTDTTVTIRNKTGAFPDLNGWLVVGPRLAYPLPRNVMILPGASLNVHFAPVRDQQGRMVATWVTLRRLSGEAEMLGNNKK